jgi:hypothetical protein
MKKAKTRIAHNRGKKKILTKYGGRFITDYTRMAKAWTAVVLFTTVVAGGTFQQTLQEQSLIDPKVVVHEVQAQVIEPEKEVVEFEVTPSKRLRQHIEKRSDVWLKIKEHFPNEAVYAGELIARESSFNEFAINPTSGACGLAQSLPCEKMTRTCALEDIDCQLEWIGNYVENRYGSFQEAVRFQDTNNWY